MIERGVKYMGEFVFNRDVYNDEEELLNTRVREKTFVQTILHYIFTQ